MKRTFNWVYKTLMLVAGVVAMTACSSDKTPEEGPKEFPVFADISVVVDTEGTIDFNAYAVWTISSDKQWFAVSPETGVAGPQKVKYTVSADGQGFNDDSATITFKMDGREVTFKATRTAKDRMFTLFTVLLDQDKKLVETDKIDLAYSSNANDYNSNFAVRTNFDWKLTVPEWVSINPDNMSGNANPNEENPPYAWVSVDYAKATFEDMSGKMTFADQKDAAKTFVKDITAPGSKNYMISTAALEVKLNSGGQFIPSVGDPMDAYAFKVKACNDGVMFFKVAKKDGLYGVDNGGYKNYNAVWCRIFPNDEETVIGPAVKQVGYELNGAENWDAGREATVVAIPYPIVDAKGIQSAQDLVTSDDRDIKEEFQKYIITEVVQSGVAREIAFAAGQPEGITLQKLEAGNEDYDFIHSEYGVDLVYVITYNSFVQMNWATLNYNGYTGNGNLVPMFNPSENELSGSKGWISMETNGGTYMSINISDTNVPFTGERYTWIIVKDEDTSTQEFAIKAVQKVAR